MTGSRPGALVGAGWVPGRAEPDHRAEMTTQWVCGESLEALEESGEWLRCRGDDAYDAWVAAGGLARLAEAEADAWRSAADGISLGTALVPTGSGPAPPLPVPARLPLGARVRIAGDGSVELPGGARARPLDATAVVPSAELGSRFRATGEAVVATARRWLGVPYVWGGRTEWGFDCSGLVQAIFRLHGIRLPRDSGPQREAGPDVEAGAAAVGPLSFPGLLEPLLPGDLLFFAPEGRGITHVGFFAGEGRVLHAAASNACVAVDDLRGRGSLATRLRESVVGCTRPLGQGAGGAHAPRKG